MRIEKLEDRACLSAVPLGVADPWAYMDRGTVYEYPALVAHATAGKQDVPVVDLYVESNAVGDRLRTLTLRGTGINGSSLAAVVSAFEVFGDMDQDGSYEKKLASVRPTNTGVTFDRLFTEIGTQGLSLRIVADTKPTLAQQAVFGLDVSSVKFINGNKAVPGSQISIMDRNGSTVVVDPQECVLFGGLYSPPDVRYNPGTRDAVLGRFDSFTPEGDVRVNQLAFVIEGRDSRHNPITTSVLAKALSYVELRNVQTGQVIQASRHLKGDGYLVFSAKDFVLKNGQSWEIRADIADSSVVRQGDRFRVGINMEENPQSLTSFNGLLPRRVANMSFLATDIDSKKKVEVQPSGVLFGNYVQVARLVSQGDLFVTNSMLPILNRQLLGGTLGDPIMMLELRGSNEPIDVFKLGFQSMGSYATSVDRLELYKAGATSPFAIATLAGTGSDPVPTGSSVFTANMQSRQLIVPEGETLTILVRARMKSDAQGGISGERIQFQLHRVEARGSDSSNNLLPNDGDTVREGEVFIGTNAAGPNAPVVGSRNIVSMSKVAAIANANPDPDNSPVPIGVSSVGQFRFLAASNLNSQNGLNRVQIGGLIVSIDASNVEVDASSFYLSNKADGATRVQGVLRDASGARLLGNQMLNGTYYVEFNNLHQSIVSTMIDPGQSATLVVSAEIRSSGAGAGLQMSLNDFNNPLSSSFGWNASHVQWNDMDVFSTPFYGFEYPETVVRSTRYR